MSDVPGLDDVEEIKTRALQELESASSLDELERWRIAYLGRSGDLTQVLRGLGALPSEERRTVGAAANKAKSLLEEGLAGRQQALEQVRLTSQAEQEQIDVTLELAFCQSPVKDFTNRNG